MSNANRNHSNQNSAHQQHGTEQIDTATALGNSLPGGFQAIAALYGDLAKQSYKPCDGFVAKMTPTNR